jgi:hypothetical protein
MGRERDMTNREKFLKKLREMTNEQLARVFCKVSWCSDCPARVDCFDLSGIKEVADWLAKGGEAERSEE